MVEKWGVFISFSTKRRSIFLHFKESVHTFFNK